MLRCFNDCFAVLGLWAAIYCYQRNQWHLGSFFYTTGLNVKMSLLLPLPAMGILMIQAVGSREAMTQAMIIFQVSVCCNMKITSALTNHPRFSLDIRSGNRASATLAARSSSPEHSSTSGLSTGASSRKTHFFQSHSLLACWLSMLDCFCSSPTHGGSNLPNAHPANSSSLCCRPGNPEIRTSCQRG